MTKNINAVSAKKAKGENTRYLSFTLGEEEFAIPLLYVKEVIAVPEVTPVPFTPAYFLGIMNLRGQVISVLDLRLKMGIKSNQSAETAVIICDLDPLCLGVVVDSINSVVAPSAEDLAERPEIQSQRSSEFITGVFKKEKSLVLLLDIAKALSVEDIQTLKKNLTSKSPIAA
jgi:purine-binding chemotaxis protein CheW